MRAALITLVAALLIATAQPAHAATAGCNTRSASAQAGGRPRCNYAPWAKGKRL